MPEADESTASRHAARLKSESAARAARENAHRQVSDTMAARDEAEQQRIGVELMRTRLGRLRDRIARIL